ncbi:hypothetical protein B9Z19DRAFT_1100291 [Tuber borchii]|uniref:Uncharacterized protein n=1 Tax=Tuber borchii TaxID=42251 RepID=A0A2T6ZY50_TUBBO|nr:hypothetical protein B9Z19DRAFT_1100291 [Tuber borchii]
MALNRSLIRNVWFHETRSQEKTLRGPFQNGSITEGNFLDILGIVLVVQGNPLQVQERESGHILSQTDIPLNKGVYDIYCDVSIKINNKPWIPRSITHYTGSRADRFCHQLRNRDRKCVISGLINPKVQIKANNWLGFEPAHIFPPEQEGLWTLDDYGRSITDINDSFEIAKIDSCQNCFLLSSDIRQGFEQYLISVNPDDNYKIIVFDIDMLGLEDRILDPLCRNPEGPHREGEPIFEHDFPPGHDIVEQILAVLYGQERFELEIASRLRELHKDKNLSHGEALQLQVQ